MTYAENTQVPVERSKAELDRLLAKFGATQRYFASDDDAGYAVVGFAVGGRKIRIRVPVPRTAELQPRTGAEPHGWKSWVASKRTEWVARQRAQLERERWRLLVIGVKAKLEYIAIGLSTYDREFLADVVLSDGKTVYEMIGARVADAYASGRVPPLLLGPATGES